MFDYNEKEGHFLKLVNEQGVEIDKTATKKEVHDQHLWHVETAVFIINNKNQILLHKRSENVRYNKNKWAIPTNHVEKGQTNIDALIERVFDLHKLRLEEKDFRYIFVQKRDEEQQKRFTYYYYVRLNTEKEFGVNDILASECKWEAFEDIKDKMLQDSEDIVFRSSPAYLSIFGALAKIINDEKPKRKQEFVLLNTTDGVVLPASLYSPEKVSDSVVIFIHGSGANFYKTAYYDPIINELNKHNIAFFAANNRGSEQFTRFYKVSNQVSTAYKGGAIYENFDESLFDVSAAVDFVKDRGYKNITLVGQSLGTAKVLNFVEKIGGINNIILVSAVDMVARLRARVKENYDVVIEQSRQAVNSGDQYRLITPEFSAIRILSTMAQGSSGDILQFEESRAFKKKLGYKGKVVVVAGIEDHVYKDFDFAHIKRCFDYQFSNAKQFDFVLADGADHMFRGKETELAKLIAKYSQN